jgi:hypothetical protein
MKPMFTKHRIGSGKCWCRYREQTIPCVRHRTTDDEPLCSLCVVMVVHQNFEPDGREP